MADSQKFASELEAGADAGTDNGSHYIRYRRELHVFNLAPQKNIVRDRPIEPPTDREAIQERAILPGTVAEVVGNAGGGCRAARKRGGRGRILLSIHLRGDTVIFSADHKPAETIGQELPSTHPPRARSEA